MLLAIKLFKGKERRKAWLEAEPVCRQQNTEIHSLSYNYFFG